MLEIIRKRVSKYVETASARIAEKLLPQWNRLEDLEGCEFGAMQVRIPIAFVPKNVSLPCLLSSLPLLNAALVPNMWKRKEHRTGQGEEI